MDSQSQEDSWQPNENNSSIFNKIQQQFSDEQINQTLQDMLSKPNYLEDEVYDEENDEQLIEKKQQKTQGLYNPLEDDQNEKWMKKIQKTKMKPLICPNCFTQLAYSYRQTKNQYFVEKPNNIIVNETKIIRNRDISDTIEIKQLSEEEQEKQLNERQQEFNVKIVCHCSCGIDVGYFDVNKSLYVLLNVI